MRWKPATSKHSKSIFVSGAVRMNAPIVRMLTPRQATPVRGKKPITANSATWKAKPRTQANPDLMMNASFNFFSRVCAAHAVRAVGAVDLSAPDVFARQPFEVVESQAHQADCVQREDNGHACIKHDQHGAQIIEREISFPVIMQAPGR